MKYDSMLAQFIQPICLPLLIL